NLILEPTGPRALSAYGFWRGILRGGLEMGTSSADARMRTAPSTGGSSAAKTDEGDFADFQSAITRSQQTVIDEMDRGAEEMAPFLAHVNRLMAMLGERPATRDRGTFVGRYYLPFFAEL